MRYGMNPHQAARAVDARGPVRILSGEPSMINWLDLLNGWMLVREAAASVGKPVAASFKHVSPAGVATAGHLDDVAQEVWGVGDGLDGTLLSAYVRARDVDPKSSFGDAIALSEPCDLATAQMIGSVIADAIIAPGFEAGAVEVLSLKKGGRFLVVQVDPDYEPPAWESREVFGVLLEQERDTLDIEPLVPKSHPLREDLILSLITLHYTQSNSVCVATDGAVRGIGAGQQNRIDCTRLACGKAHSWWLRRHPNVRGLRTAGMRRQDLLNWQIQFAERTLLPHQEAALAGHFGADAVNTYTDDSWRGSWEEQLSGLALASDGFLPFRDNVELAASLGVSVLIEPGGSARSSDIGAAAAELGVEHLTTGARLFHH